MLRKQNGCEDILRFSRIQTLHHCLEVDYHDEEGRLINFLNTEQSENENSEHAKKNVEE